MAHMRSAAVLGLFTLLLLSASAEPARGGGGPESTAVVVNENSWASLAVANEFISLRKVPPRNVIYLPCPQFIERMSVEDFRKHILQPVLDAIEQRGLSGQIDCIAYSADLPTEIDIAADATKAAIAKLPQRMQTPVTPGGSANGLTFLYTQVLAKDIHYGELNANHYFRPIFRKDNQYGAQPSVAFRHGAGWDASGQAVAPGEGAPQYYLSTVLAVTDGRGNSVREAIRCLQSAAGADGNGIAGTVYFLKNGDVRSKTREPFFAAAVEELKALGVSAEVVDGVLPKDQKDVAGLMTGAPSFNWKACGSEILPGAICENFTSWGGVLREGQGGGQTPLTDFIRCGAAGSSGTVTEPYAIPNKFPTAFMQVHYVRGCSLAEAFYQSVNGPYQLLIVGDPLCQPWAKVPKVRIECKNAGGATVAAGATIGPEKFTVRGVVEANESETQYELYVDGARQAVAATEAGFPLDANVLASGYHEIRVVAISAIEPRPQGFAAMSLTLTRGEPAITVTPPKEKWAAWDAPFSLSAKMDGAKRILFLQNDRQVGAIEGGSGTAKIDLRKVGQGHVRIQPVGVITRGGKEMQVPGAPIDLEVRPPIPVTPPAPPNEGDLAKGVLVTTADGKKVAFEKHNTDWLRGLSLKDGQEFQVHGVFAAPDDDTYQFQFCTNIALTMELDGKPVEVKPGSYWSFVPVSLAKGTHRMLLKGKAIAGPVLDVRFGGEGTQYIANVFRHQKVAGETPGK